MCVCTRVCFVPWQFCLSDCFVTHHDCLCRVLHFRCLSVVHLTLSSIIVLVFLSSNDVTCCLSSLYLRPLSHAPYSFSVCITTMERSQNGKCVSVPLSIYVSIICISCTLPANSPPFFVKYKAMFLLVYSPPP